MIEGSVTQSVEAIVVIEVSGPTGHSLKIPAAIDTGFTGELVLSSSIIRTLGLQPEGTRKGTLADGQEISFAIFRASVDWHRKRIEVGVVESDSNSLLGMGLLTGSRLWIEVVAGGKVSIAPIRRRPK